jgi:hypothetical protein
MGIYEHGHGYNPSSVHRKSSFPDSAGIPDPSILLPNPHDFTIPSKDFTPYGSDLAISSHFPPAHLLTQMRDRRPELTHIDTNLRLDQSRQCTPIPQIHPFSSPRSLFRILSFTQYHIVVAFRAGERRGEPDLFVGRLFVDYICAVGGEGEGEYSGLERVYRLVIIYLDVLCLLG